MALHEQFKRQGDFLFKNRGHLPLLVILVGLIVFIFERFHIDCTSFCSQFSFDFKYELCFAIGLVGFFIRCHVVGYAPDRTSGRNLNAQVADVLNTKGMYSIVRHPLYLANFLMWLSIALLTGNLWFIIAFTLFYILYYERIMYTEEAFLIDKFKEDYLVWSRKTPAAIPNFHNYKKTENTFNLKVVLKREKNGLLAMLTLFWLFELIDLIIHYYLSGERFEYTFSFWFFATLFMAIYYVILKIKKITKRK